jgi:hypothetical protein
VTVVGPQAASTQSRVSGNGRYLLFTAAQGKGLLSRYGGSDYDHGTCNIVGQIGCRELYLYDAQTEQLLCVSCRSDGLPPAVGSAATSLLTDKAGVARRTAYLNRVLSDDGRYVFFTSEEDLVEEDTNGVSDAYLYDVQKEQAFLLSSGTSARPSYFLDNSDSGSDAFILTPQQLVGWDRDLNYDLYDVRINGGFPEPAPVPSPCQGESCLAGATSPPVPLAAASSALFGRSDPKPKRRCARAHRRHTPSGRRHRDRCKRTKGLSR